MPGLSVSDLVSVEVSLSPQAAITQNFGSLLLVSAASVINVTERIRKYTSLTQVGNDFGSSAPEYAAAQAFYSQNPQPSILYIGRWAQSATAGQLVGSLVAQHANLSAFTTVTNGSMAITIDGTVKTISTLNLSTASSLSAVAALLTTALASASAVWDPNYNRFVITSNTTGTSSAVSFATPTGSGTDVSALFGLTSAQGGFTAAGGTSETLLAAVQALAAVSNDWYGLAFATSLVQNSDVLAAAGYVEASKPQRFLVVTTQDPATLNAATSSDLASQLQALGYNHTAVQYSSSSLYAAVSLFARQATVNFTAQNSTITLMFKGEPGIAAETLNESQAAALKAKSCNVFVNYSNATAIIQSGTVASGQYIDTIVGLDWLQNNVQTAVFNLLHQSTTKIPQTDPGVNLIVSTVHSCMDAAVNNGLVAPGVWTGPALGAIQTGQTLAAGYYVYAPPVASQSQADRSARKAPSIQALVKLGGAIHSADVAINVVQ